jgi:hypothetical protein
VRCHVRILGHFLWFGNRPYDAIPREKEAAETNLSLIRPRLQTFGSASAIHQYFQRWRGQGFLLALGQAGLAEYDELGMVTAPPEPVYAVMVIAPLLVVKVKSWLRTAAGRVRSKSSGSKLLGAGDSDSRESSFGDSAG